MTMRTTTFKPVSTPARAFIVVILLCGNGACVGSASAQSTNAERVFAGQGVVENLGLDGDTLTVKHEAISDFMPSMTMPFRVETAKELTGLKRGDEVSFHLHVTATDSYLSQLTKIGTADLSTRGKVGTPSESPARPMSGNPLLDYKFTNELGHAVSLHDFLGQALAVTFFYTRCPLPQFCPRLSKNFQQAEKILSTMAGAPTNWHLISVSFDPGNDTAETLKQYGESYGYNPKHWSFLTGPADKIAELARASGVEYEADGATINHNFRTLIIDPSGNLQTVFPVSGDLSDQIVAEILKATKPAKQLTGNKSASPNLASRQGVQSAHATQ